MSCLFCFVKDWAVPSRFRPLALTPTRSWSYEYANTSSLFVLRLGLIAEIGVAGSLFKLFCYSIQIFRCQRAMFASAIFVYFRGSETYFRCLSPWAVALTVVTGGMEEAIFILWRHVLPKWHLPSILTLGSIFNYLFRLVLSIFLHRYLVSVFLRYPTLTI
jgi:hypothetical protein